MSDEKPSVETEAEEREETASTPTSRSGLPPAVILAFVIIALLGSLIVMTLKGQFGGSSVDSEELKVLKAKISAAEQDVNASRVALGLRPREGTGEPIEDVAARMRKDAETMVALASSYQSMLGEKDLEISSKSAQLLQSEQLRQGLSAELEKLRQQLGNALVGASEMEMLRKDNDNLKAQRDALNAELVKVRADLASRGEGVSADDYADLQRHLEETQRAKDFLEARVKDLDAQLSKAKLFANSENELIPAAVELFRSLRKLEGKPDSEISTAYSSLGVTLGANVLRTLSFATGSSELTAEDSDAIRNLVTDIPDGDLVFVVGYASETGNVDKNQDLSSARATAAAELFASAKRPGQLVQAVYLGQTDRFSSRIPERNQIVEVWRIRKK